RADQDKIVIHNVKALYAIPLLDEFFLLRFGMDEDNIGITAPPGLDRLPGALRHHLHVGAAFLLEARQNVLEKPRILRGRRRGLDDRFVLRQGCKACGGKETYRSNG